MIKKIRECFGNNFNRMSDENLKVRIVCYEDVDSWILGKFAKKINENLLKLGVVSDIAKEPDPRADINHHIIYLDYNGEKLTNETVMITHIDSVKKVELIKRQLAVIRMGICMSKETMDKLVIYGVPREKLCYINPAHDGIIQPKKFVIGLTSKFHDDFRKKESFLLDICSHIEKKYFSFKIMGAGWTEIIEKMREMGFQVDYYDHFDYDTYVKLIPSLDYYLYFGFDEGSMGYLDALAAGVKTIVTPQGYHLDVKNGITYPCESLADIVDICEKIANERRHIVKSVVDLTWENYTKKHLEIWNYILKKRSLEESLINRGRYTDGIFSMLLRDIYA